MHTHGEILLTAREVEKKRHVASRGVLSLLHVITMAHVERVENPRGGTTIGTMQPAHIGKWLVLGRHVPPPHVTWTAPLVTHLIVHGTSTTPVLYHHGGPIAQRTRVTRYVKRRVNGRPSLHVGF